MFRLTVLGVALLVTLVPAMVAGGSGDTAPFANAGLDQTVERNVTVYLDGGGSYDPDGELVDYTWRIRTPDGDETTPACADCENTEFTPNETGRFNVTLAVRDDDGNVRSDYLYVTVEQRHGPSATLSGPSSASSGENLTYEVSASAGEADLAGLTWKRDGNVTRTTLIDGEQVSANYSFDYQGRTDSVSVTVTDIDGQQSSAQQTIQQSSDDSSLTNWDYRHYGANMYTTSKEDFGDKSYDLGDKTVHTDFNGDGTTNVNGQSVDASTVTTIDKEESTVVYENGQKSAERDYNDIY